MAIIVEHFRTHMAKALGGRAKAMVVTDSRSAAVNPRNVSGGLEIGSDIVLTHHRLAHQSTAEIELVDRQIEPGKPFPGGWQRSAWRRACV